VLDLRSPADLRKFRRIGDEVSALVRQFKGSLAAEHGVGMARTEYMPEQVGEALLGAMREIKHSFDPHNLFNPGKIIPDESFAFDTRLRLVAEDVAPAPFPGILAFAARDGSFNANLDQCNGCGGCRKETPSMCPTFLVTGDEGLSTRGRANIIRAAIENRFNHGQDPLECKELETVLNTCLSCKACVVECPSNVNLPLLKAELLHARIKRSGLSLKQRVFSGVDLLGAVGCAFPWLANQVLDSFLVRTFGLKVLGIGYHRPLPHYAKRRFDKWFKSRPKISAPAPRGRVVLWDDTFVRYHEPHVGAAAVKVLEAAGFEVSIVRGRKCCGRPAFSQGHLDRVLKLGRHNLALLENDVEQPPIIFLEPSCYTMFAEDYIELKLENASRVALRCFMFEDFIERLLGEEPDALRFKPRGGRLIIHAHCHLKSRMNPGFLKTLAERIPEREVTLLNSGCCGMAGAFGMLKNNYELSLKVAEPLMQQIRGQPFGTSVVASGTSCRQQISHLAPIRPRHMAEVLAESLI
jgi:Fe-S oxidoreductase